MNRKLIIAILGASLALASCGSSPPSHGGVSAGTTTVPAATTAPPTTPTTIWSATAPQSSPFAAATRLVSAWASGNQAVASTVASPNAVSTLFAQPYPAGYLQARGCTSGANPATCTYRNTKTNGIYEIEISSGSGGWYVSSVTPES